MSSSSSQDPTIRDQLKVYLKTVGMGCFFVIILIFTVFPIYWGSLYKIPAQPLPGWVVDFDGGIIGQTVTQALSNYPTKVRWTIVSANRFRDVEAVANEVYDENVWVAVTINPQATAQLQASLASPNASYDGSDAVNVFAVEARNENAFRTIIRPTIQASFDSISKNFAVKLAQQIAASPNVTNLLQVSPQTIVQPIFYRLINLAPFDQPVATAVTFVGLIYQLILSFFVVIICLNGREQSGLEKSLSTRKLILLRLCSSFTAYFFISLFYALVSLAFKLDTTKTFGQAGFLVFWMLNYVGMLSLGLALEALVTLLTPRFIPFFMLTWIISNVAVCIFPLEIMPSIYLYGKAAPFYNVSNAMRTVIFGTKNVVGFSFGILFVWIAISCITLPLIQVWMRRRDATRTASLSQDDDDAKVERKVHEQVDSA